MGWLDKIFKIGSKASSSEYVEPEQMQEETVGLRELLDWVEKKSNEGFEKVKPQIEEQFSQIIEAKKEVLVHLDDLREAKLQNPNISEREKQIMEGNRSTFISQHKQFINIIDISDDVTCKEASFFCSNFEELLSRLAKSTGRAHAVMNEFFAHQTAKVNRDIKTMSDAVNRIKELLDQGNVGIEDIGDVQKAVSELRSKKKLASEIDDEVKTINKKLDNSDYLKQKLQKSIEKLKQTDDYTKFRQSDEKRNELWKRVKQTEDEVGVVFSPINKAMRKYERMLAEDTNLFNMYIESPMKALIDDDTIRIVELLGKMKLAISQGRLELKDGDKAVHRIDDINKQALTEARTRYLEAKRSIKQIDDSMRDSKVLGELNDLQYKMEHTESQIKILLDKKEKAEQTKGKIDLGSLKSEVEARIKDVFNVGVNITWQEDSQTQSQSS